MSREWKPGDVARTVNNGTIARTARHRWILLDDGHPIDLADEKIARPLVVIDPEDAGQVERLALAYKGTWQGSRSTETTEDIVTRQMRAALREFANPTPPKPEEPTGLGAVVEEADGTRWTRVESASQPSRNPWYPADDPDLQPDEWVGIPAVRVLSEGIQ